jgi:hypothetical protein
MLLAKLLQTLTHEEIAKVRNNFQLPERSRLLFERVASTPYAPPDSVQLSKAFQISKENLYRLFSEIVDECVRILAPKEEFAMMKFYQRKYLYRPFVTELHRIEKKLLKEYSSSDLEQFYGYCFYALPSFTISEVDLDLTEEIGMKWHRSKKDPPIDDDLSILAKIVFIRIAALPARKKMTLEKGEKASIALLEPIRERGRNTSNPVARHQYYQAEWKGAIFKGIDPRRLEFLQKSLDVIHRYPTFFSKAAEEVNELQIANEIASTGTRVRESFDIYSKHYNGQTSETSRGALFLDRFMKIAFLAKEYTLGWELLERFENNPAILNIPTLHIISLLNRIKLQIVGNDLAGASTTLADARKALSESFFLAYEIPLRGLEILIALKQNNLKYTDQLVTRNIKWLRSRKVSKEASGWIYYYKLIRAIILRRQTKEEIKPSLIEYYKNKFRPEYPDFYILLEGELA